MPLKLAIVRVMMALSIVLAAAGAFIAIRYRADNSILEMTIYPSIGLALVLWLLTQFVDRRGWGGGVLVLMAGAGVAWLAIVSTEYTRLLASGRYAPRELEEIAFWTLLVTLVLAPAFALRHVPRARVAAWALIASCAIVWPLYILFFMMDRHTFSSWGRAQDAALHAFFLAIPTSLLLVNVGRDRRHFRWLGMLVAVLALLSLILCESGNLTDQHAIDWGTRCTVFYTATIALAHINLVLLATGSGIIRLFKWTAVAASLAAVAFDSLDLLPERMQMFQNSWTSAALKHACVLVALGMSLALILAVHLRKPRPGLTAPAEVQSVDVICPLCQTRTALTPSGGTCPTCRLQFQLKLIEPHCDKCGYLLYRQQGRCPECGFTIHPAPPTAPVHVAGNTDAV